MAADGPPPASPESGPVPEPARGRWRDRLAWYRARLAAMGASEVGRRLGDAVAHRAQALGIGTRRRVPAPDVEAPGASWIDPRPGVDPAPYVRAADDALAGTVTLFSVRHEVGAPPRWNRDPRSGREPPLGFGRSLDLRDPGRTGDVRCIWELNRHAHVVRLAQAFALTGERRYLDGVGAQIASWIEQCPHLRGPNWASGLEAALRLVNWSLAWQLAGGARSPLFAGDEGRALRRSWLDSVYRQMRFVTGAFSYGSSANNHAIGEAAGLAVAAATWPCWPEARRWGRLGLARLAGELRAQTTAEGVDREQAFGYHLLVAGLALVARQAALAAGEAPPPAVDERLRAMAGAVAALVDAGGELPAIGDGDDAVAAALDASPDPRPARSLLASAAVLFDRPDWAREARCLDDGSRWLLGEAGGERFAALACAAVRAPAPRAFPEAGYWLLADPPGTPSGVRLLADAGPLGYLSLCAHGHADALAVWLWVAGEPILVDAGTYTYHGSPRWRHYFRSARAHNTLTVDGEDQSVQGGPFLWTAKARARCERWEPGPERDRWAGSHDGYRRLPDPVIHRREVELDKVGRRIRVADTLRCARAHEIRRRWHLAPECRVTLAGERATVRRGPVVLEMHLGGPGCEVSILRASEDPPGGWVSRRYGQREPATTIEVLDRIDGTATLETGIALPGAEGAAAAAPDAP